jgi:hypothetical protein
LARSLRFFGNFFFDSTLLYDGILRSDIWKQNIYFCNLLNNLILQSSDGIEKGQLAERVLYLMSKNKFASSFFDIKFIRYIQAPEVKELMLTHNNPDLIVSVFADSRSFADARDRSKIIDQFRDRITDEQLRIIVESCRKNDQIQLSWGAQSSLKQLFLKNKEKIPPIDLDYLQKNDFI